MKTKTQVRANTVTGKSLAYWLRKTGTRQAELAEKTGISQPHISQMASGQKNINAEFLERICEAFGISLPDFFACESAEEPEIVFVPLVRARPRAGTGGLETDGDEAGRYAFHASFLERKRGSVLTMRLFVVEGDSMEPTLKSGDMIMVNTSDEARHVITGNIYLLRMGDELMVKRLETRLGGVLLVRSDNPAYEDIPVQKDEVDGEVEVFGRMVWSCREY